MKTQELKLDQVGGMLVKKYTRFTKTFEYEENEHLIQLAVDITQEKYSNNHQEHLRDTFFNISLEEVDIMRMTKVELNMIYPFFCGGHLWNYKREKISKIREWILKSDGYKNIQRRKNIEEILN